MKTEPADVASGRPRAVPWWLGWVIAAVLAAALAGAIAAAVHYRGETAALRRQIRPSLTLPASHLVPPALSSDTARLPPYRSLHGQITVFSALAAGQQAQIMLTAGISGGKPHTRYELLGFDCNGSAGYQAWAAGTTGADGAATLSGTALTVSLHDYYWLYLSLPSRNAGPSLLGHLTATGRFSAAAAGNPACK